MAAPKKKQTTTNPTNIFDFLNQITYLKNKDFYNQLPEDGQKVLAPFIIQRFLSMDIGLLPYVNAINKFTFLYNGKFLPKSGYYTTAVHLIPKAKRYLKYIKGEKDGYLDFLLEHLSKIHMCSVEHAHDIASIMAQNHELIPYAKQLGLTTDQMKKVKASYGE